MGKPEKGTRVQYVGPHISLKGAVGFISEIEQPNAVGATVLWGNGVEYEYFNYWSELIILPDATPTAEAARPDPVNQPQHYASGEIECIDAIRASMTKEAFCGYLKGNVQKYMWRYEKKVNPVEDIKKARWYSERLIKELEDA